MKRRARAARETAVALAPDALPRATYRVQLHSGFRFVDATALVPYLAALGISHLYCSPYLRARPGSRHGYDIVDHAMLNPEIGTRAEFDTMIAALQSHGMSNLCDVVPNHMAIMGRDNAWWMDVLENGAASRYAGYFDIDWAPLDPDLAGKVLVPILGDHYGAVLTKGELALAFEADSGTFAVCYFDHRLPLDPRTSVTLIEAALGLARGALPERAVAELESLVEALRRLPARDAPPGDEVATRRRDAPLYKERLAELVRAHEPLRTALEAVVRRHHTADTAALHALLEAQAFRLAYWRVASDEINYRRFFDINELASLRMEDDEVFAATHGFVLELAAEGHVGGLRVDHPDGLHDPAGYFERLQATYRDRVSARGATSGLYVVIEKISAPHECLPTPWPIHGDTGYPFANAIVSVLMDPTARARMDRVWRAFVGDEAREFETAAYEGKRSILRGPLAAGLQVLAGQALRIARADPHTRDFTLLTLHDVLAEVLAWFPVYRTYITEEGASAQDRRYIDWAVSRARNATRIADPSVFDFVRALMIAEPSSPAGYLDFAMRFQQFSAPVAAKGVEDTAFYTHTRFVALNDVGGDPAQFGMTRRAFHRITLDRSRRWPHSLLATSTHDNKRSEDVRARLAVLSELASAWRLTVRRWSRLNRTRKTLVRGAIAPSRSDEYLLYQTLVGSLPPQTLAGTALDEYRERIVAYMTKAAREAKLRTSWLAVDDEYEQALTAFVTTLLTENRFLDDLRVQSATIAWYGLLNSLSMTLVKLASPGVPDLYQGNELMDYSLVDPDNRRPVDYDARRSLLDSLGQLGRAGGDRIAAALFATPYDGRAKLWIVHRLLDFRRRERALFDYGDYVPLAAAGARSRHVLAFARRRGERGMVAVAGRLFASMGMPVNELPVGAQAWSDTSLDPKVVPAGTRVTDVLSGASFVAGEAPWALAQVFAHLPGAMLTW